MNQPPALPVATLTYYDDPDTGRGVPTLVRRLGFACIGLGAVWVVAHGWAAAGMVNSLMRPGGAFTSAYALSSTVFALLAVPLLIGGILSTRACPGNAARVLLLIYAIGMLSLGVIARLINQFSFGLDRVLIPGQLANFAASIGLIVAFPVLLLIVLSAPSVCAAYR